MGKRSLVFGLLFLVGCGSSNGGNTSDAGLDATSSTGNTAICEYAVRCDFPLFGEPSADVNSCLRDHACTLNKCPLLAAYFQCASNKACSTSVEQPAVGCEAQLQAANDTPCEIDDEECTEVVDTGIPDSGRPDTGTTRGRRGDPCVCDDEAMSDPEGVYTSCSGTTNGCAFSLSNGETLDCLADLGTGRGICEKRCSSNADCSDYAGTTCNEVYPSISGNRYKVCSVRL